MRGKDDISHADGLLMQKTEREAHKMTSSSAAAPRKATRKELLEKRAAILWVCHQHPHCDQGRVGTYQDLDIFPFDALHGFGVNPFSLWILPPGLEYGFMHTFAADQIVFIRGDCVYAGVPSPVPRGHYEFFPLLSAGWTRRNPY